MRLGNYSTAWNAAAPLRAGLNQGLVSRTMPDTKMDGEKRGKEASRGEE